MRNVLVGLLLVALSSSSLSAFTRDEESTHRWREDIAYFERELPRRHPKPFHHLSQQDFESMVHALDQRVPSLRDHEIIVEIARIVASLGLRDGHSRVNLWNRAVGFHALPVNFYVYSDGLFVRAAAKTYAGIVGLKVVSIGGMSVDAALSAAGAITPADNPMSRRSNSAEILSIPEVLRALHIASGEPADPVAIEVESRDGVRRVVDVTPLATLESVEWTDLRDEKPAQYRRFGPKDPFGRHEPQKNFWFDYDDAAQVLYVNDSVVGNSPEESVAAFFGRVFDFADAHPVRKFILDIRNNSGGNNYLNRPILYGLVRRDQTIGRAGALFVIIGRETFSAAQNLANMLDMHTNAIFAGEPTGGSPNHYGDALPLILPYSRLPIQISSVWWQDQDPRDQRIWIAPQIAAEASSADDRTGRDPVMDAISSYVPEPALGDQVKQALAAGGRPKAEDVIRAWRSAARHKFLTGESELNLLGASLYGEKRPDDAVTVFELNALINPSSWLAHNSLGRAYAAAGKTDGALVEFRRALEIRPNAPETLSAMDRLAAAK